MHVKHTHDHKCRCTKCQFNFRGKTVTHNQGKIKTPANSKYNWKEYDAEFADFVSPLHILLESGEINRTEVASELNTLLTSLLASKPNILKEVKTFFKHKPSATTKPNDARKLTNLLKKSHDRKMSQ